MTATKVPRCDGLITLQTIKDKSLLPKEKPSTALRLLETLDQKGNCRNCSSDREFLEKVLDVTQRVRP
jgi:hypothetical protein